MARYKIIGADRREYGPVNADELRQWINDGRLNAQSPARDEDGTEWNPLVTFPEFSRALRPTTAQPVTGVAPLKPTDWADQILARESELRLGECFRSGVSFFTANAAFVVSAVFVTWLLKLVVFFPIIGGMLHLLLGGVLTGGLYFACLRRMRGERASVRAVFDGFRLCFVQLMLAGAISGLLTQLGFLFCLVPGFYLLVAWTFALPLVADKRLEFWSAMELSRKIVTRVWFPVFLLLTLVFLPVVVLQCVATFKIGAYFLGTLQEAGFDLARLLPQVPELIRELVARSVFWAVGIQAALLICQFFAVGALMRAYENLFGARNS